MICMSKWYIIISIYISKLSKHVNLILLIFYQNHDFTKRIFFLKKTEIELELLTDVDMLLMVKKGIICHVTANNKYMKDYNRNNES